MDFKDNLQKIRKDRRYSQEDLAAQLNVSRQAVAKWEAGSAFPDIKNLVKMSEILCVTIDSLVKNDVSCSTKLASISDINEKYIVEFLNLSIRNTYASMGMEEKTPMLPNTHEYIFRQGTLKYIDSYMGGEQFSGRVIVFDSDHPLWTMNYTGHTLNEAFSIDFLKEALRLAPVTFPVRGPELYKRGASVYHNSIAGNFGWFQGKEEVFNDETKVYECFFHGGIIK